MSPGSRAVAAQLVDARLLVAVLEANPAGRRFWEREGFRLARTAPPRRYGDRIHVAHRLARPL